MYIFLLTFRAPLMKMPYKTNLCAESYFSYEKTTNIRYTSTIIIDYIDYNDWSNHLILYNAFFFISSIELASSQENQLHYPHTPRIQQPSCTKSLQTNRNLIFVAS